MKVRKKGKEKKETIQMEYGYGIQKLSEEIANRKAYDQEKLSIHFQNLESVNPEDYNTPGKSALKTLQVFCQNQDRRKKAEITRLKNLLKNYRDHVITKSYDALKRSPYNKEITEVIESVDNAINLLIRGL